MQIIKGGLWETLLTLGLKGERWPLPRSALCSLWWPARARKAVTYNMRLGRVALLARASLEYKQEGPAHLPRGIRELSGADSALFRCVLPVHVACSIFLCAVLSPRRLVLCVHSCVTEWHVLEWRTSRGSGLLVSQPPLTSVTKSDLFMAGLDVPLAHLDDTRFVLKSLRIGNEYVCDTFII